MALKGKQKQHLRGLGHALDAVVQVGKNGLTDALASALDDALATHELVKIRMHPEGPEDRDETAAALAARVHAEVVQILGRTVLLYRKHPTKTVVTLPR